MAGQTCNFCCLGWDVSINVKGNIIYLCKYYIYNRGIKKKLGEAGVHTPRGAASGDRLPDNDKGSSPEKSKLGDNGDEIVMIYNDPVMHNGEI